MANRLRTVSRSLLSKVANYGQTSLWQQAVGQGFLDNNAYKRMYLKNTERHADRHGQVVGINERFPVEPGEDVNCGCGQILKRV